MVKFVGKNLSGMAQSWKRICGIVIFGNDSDIKIGDHWTYLWLMSVTLVSIIRCVVNAWVKQWW